MLDRQCVGLLQPDVTWCGGITEARRIVALASASDIPIIPHGSSIYSYHLQYAFPNLPMSEFIFLSPLGDQMTLYFEDLFLDESSPQNGSIHLDPAKPDFGVTMNKNLPRRLFSLQNESFLFHFDPFFGSRRTEEEPVRN